MTPGFKFLGSVFIAVLLFVAIVKGAKAEEVKEPEVNLTCVLALAPDVERLKAMHAKDTDYWVARHLVLTDPTNRDAARWALMLILDGLYDGRLAPDRAITALWGICTIPMAKHGAVPEKDEKYLQQHDEGGQFRPLKREYKDI